MKFGHHLSDFSDEKNTKIKPTRLVKLVLRGHSITIFIVENNFQNPNVILPDFCPPNVQ